MPRESRREEGKEGGRQEVTQGGNHRMDVRRTREMKNNGREEGAGRRGEDKETGVRRQKLKIKMNALARRPLVSEKARHFQLPVLGQLSIKIYSRSHEAGLFVCQSCARLTV